jgi:hypothetical protein
VHSPSRFSAAMGMPSMAGIDHLFFTTRLQPYTLFKIPSATSVGRCPGNSGDLSNSCCRPSVFDVFSQLGGFRTSTQSIPSIAAAGLF